MSLEVSAVHGSSFEYSPELKANEKFINCVHTVNEEKSVDCQEDPDAAKAYREQLIEKYKDKYDIKLGMDYSYSLGKEVPVYYITAKKDVDLGALKSDLKIKPRVIGSNNSAYSETYGPTGKYVDDEPMKGRTIHIPVNDLGANRGLLDRLLGI